MIIESIEKKKYKIFIYEFSNFKIKLSLKISLDFSKKITSHQLINQTKVLNLLNLKVQKN